MIRFWKSSNHDDTLQKIEGGVAFILFILWAAAIGVINELNSFSTAEALYVVANANVYYFTWACFFLVLAILGNSMQNLSLSDQGKNSRTSKWMVLVATSLIVMSACVSVFRAFDCKGVDSGFCVATKLGLGVGCCCGFISLALVCVVGKAAGDNPNKFVQVEAIVGLCLTILYAVAVAFVTGPGGPGSTIGNLYYSTWLSFFLSVAVTLDCISTVTRDMKLPTLSEGGSAGAAPPKEMPAASDQNKE
jgi:hypothetical protein